jgi:hypothetical protein
VPGLAAMMFAFSWPLYEYMRKGQIYYHPGIIFDKEFSEYTTWYLKNKIFLKGYWNLDAYLYNYHQSHNEKLKGFYEKNNSKETVVDMPSSIEVGGMNQTKSLKDIGQMLMDLVWNVTLNVDKNEGSSTDKLPDDGERDKGTHIL